MYPFERALGTYKQYVHNKTRPEGSIAKSYIINESFTFCSIYLRGIETRFNHPEQTYEWDRQMEARQDGARDSHIVLQAVLDATQDAIVVHVRNRVGVP